MSQTLISMEAVLIVLILKPLRGLILESCFREKNLSASGVVGFKKNERHCLARLHRCFKTANLIGQGKYPRGLSTNQLRCLKELES